MRISWWVLVAMVSVPLVAGGQAIQQKNFASPTEATEALIAAVRAGKATEVLSVLGKEAATTIDSGDAVQDKQTRERFIQAYETAHTLEPDGTDRVALDVGTDKWRFPFPLVKREGRWRFDTAAGADEVINRRIGENELSTIQSCAAFVDGQREYYARNPQNDALMHFARKLVSTHGQKDGLYWPVKGSEPESPLGEEFARARSEGYFHGTQHKTEPFHGYIYKLLTKQGAHAKGGAYDYIVGEKMLGGFALIAFPAEYGNSGIMSFIVSHDGVIYSKDLGANTANTAMKIDKFDPDQSWKRELEVK